MSKRIDTQVAVLGASAAGLAAARAAASAGAETVLLEGGRIGEVPSPAVVGFEALWPEDDPCPPAAQTHRFHGVDLHGPAGSRLTVEAPGRIVDRGRLDRHMAAQARAAGARILDDAGPIEATGPGRLTGDEARVEAGVVVFADGAESQAQHLLDPVRSPDRIVWGATHELDAPGPTPERLPIGLGSHAPGGRTQVVPVGPDRWWHWTFARCERSRIEPIAEAALERTARRHGWSPSTRRSARLAHVGPDPTHQLPGQLAGQRTLVAGGAGGLGGLEIGLQSGHLAGQHAAHAVAVPHQARLALDRYETVCHARFTPGYEGLAQLTALVERLDDAALARVLGPWDGHRLDLAAVSGLSRRRLGARLTGLLGLLASSPAATLGSLAGVARSLITSPRLVEGLPAVN